MGELDLILGPMLIGAVVSVFLCGIMVTQCYTYFIRFPNDPLWMRIMVFYFLVTDIFHSGVEVAIVYDYTVTLFGQMNAILRATWLFAMIPVLSVCISSVAQAFFAWRVARLTRLRILGIFIAILAFVQFLCGIGVTIAVTIVPMFTQFQKFQGLVIPWLVCSAVCDVIITCALVWYLRTNKSGIPSTDDLVTRLIRTTVQTGLMTSIWAILDLVVYLTESNSLHLVFNLPLAKIYTNSLMSTLNSRRSQQETLHMGTSGERGFSAGMAGSTGKIGALSGTSSMPTWERAHRHTNTGNIEILKTEYTHSQVTHDIPIQMSSGRAPRTANAGMDSHDDTGSYELDDRDMKKGRFESELDMA